MVNVIPPDHVDDVPVVEPNQHDDVPVVPEPVLVDEDEDPKEDEFEEEEDPQEEEDDMEVDIEEDENEPELTYPYEEVDPLNPPPPASESEPDDEIEVEDAVESEDETVPASVHEVGESSTAPFLCEDSDGLLPGLMRRDINSLFVRSSVEQGTAVIEKLVKKLSNTEDKVECKKLKKELEEAGFSNTFLRIQNERVERDLYWTRVRAHEFYQEMICRGFMFEERPNKAIDVLIKDEKSPSSESRGSPHDSIMTPKSAPMTQAAILRMIKESVDAAIAAKRERQANAKNDASRSGLVRGQDIAPTVRECTFAGFMKCNPAVFREGKKVKFVAATLEGPAFTWWKTEIATMGLDTLNQMPWTKMKQLMTAEFCPIEEVQRMDHELWNLKVKEYDVVAYTQRFNELSLMCPRNGEVTSSKPADLNEAMCMAHKLMEQKLQARDERDFGRKEAKPKARKCESHVGCHVGQCVIKCHKCGNVGNKARYCKEKNVATSVNAQPVWTCYDCGEQGSDRSFVDTRFSSMLDIDPVKIGASYEVELADGKLSTFDVIISMDWLIKHDVVIICGEKVVRIPYGNKMLIVESDKDVSRLKLKEKQLEDVPVIHDLPEVFPKELPGLPPPRQVEFRIDLVPGAASYRLASSEMKELLIQLQELLEKGFIYVKQVTLVELIDLDLLLKIIMVNIIPPNHVDDVPVVEPNQHDDVPVVPEPVLNELELTYPYEEADPLNPPSPASESETDDEIEAEDAVESEDKTIPATFHETAHALVEKKGKAKDKYYGKLILDMGNEVRSSVEQGTTAMEKIVEKLGNTEDKVECKKLKKELEEAGFSNTFFRMQNKRVEKDLYWTRVRAHEFYQEMIRKGFMFEERPNEAINVLIEDEKSPSSEPRGSPHDA
ncbi:putative reverse transcriptase domain-containing protein [Tanacetum coccineum]